MKKLTRSNDKNMTSQVITSGDEVDASSSLRWLWISIAVVIIDQLTKYLISHSMSLYQSIAIFPGFNLTLVHNAGAAFSFLNEAGGWQRWFFVSLASIVSVMIVNWMRTIPLENRRLSLALALVLGGAIGNLWDRLNYGYVIDFLDVYYQQWHWPAFNVADSAITIGVILLILDSLQKDNETPAG